MFATGLVVGAVQKKSSPSRKNTAKKSSTTAKKRSASTAKKKKRSGKSSARSGSTWRSRQLAPEPGRYREIQQALIDKGYLEGPASGQWNQDSVDALRRFQREQNLQPSGKINSLSIIALGLGPRYDSASASPVQLPVQQP